MKRTALLKTVGERMVVATLPAGGTVSSVRHCLFGDPSCGLMAEFFPLIAGTGIGGLGAPDAWMLDFVVSMVSLPVSVPAPRFSVSKAVDTTSGDLNGTGSSRSKVEQVSTCSLGRTCAGPRVC